MEALISSGETDLQIFDLTSSGNIVCKISANNSCVHLNIRTFDLRGGLIILNVDTKNPSLTPNFLNFSFCRKFINLFLITKVHYELFVAKN